MNMIRLLGAFTIVPSTVLLTLCFFVLFALQRAEAREVKALGKIVAVLLCFCAGLVLAAGVYAMITGQHPLVMALQHILRQRGG